MVTVDCALAAAMSGSEEEVCSTISNRHEEPVHPTPDTSTVSGLENIWLFLSVNANSALNSSERIVVRAMFSDVSLAMEVSPRPDGTVTALGNTPLSASSADWGILIEVLAAEEEVAARD